jgi:large subunit ribosomal protein L23
MKNAHDIIIRPVISEKADEGRELGNTYTFEVLRDANKIEIAQAVETVFQVKVKSVCTLVNRGKTRRVGKHEGKKRNWKKAYVTLMEGHSIQIFESV